MMISLSSIPTTIINSPKIKDSVYNKCNSINSISRNGICSNQSQNIKHKHRSVVIVNCKSEEETKSKKLGIGSPVIVVEAPLFIKTAAAVPCLRPNSGLVKPGDVGRSSITSSRASSSKINCTSNMEVQTKRRDFMFNTLCATFSLPVAAHFALAETAPLQPPTDVLDEFRIYTDDINKFKITIPKDWRVGAGDGKGIKSVVAFFPEEASNLNVSVVITGLGADYTRLESFGKVDSFAETLVSGLDRSWQNPPGVTAKLIDSKAANGLYYIDYSLQNPGGSTRYLYSVLGMANNGWYNRLYTLTGQFLEEEADKYASEVAKVVGSFRLTN